MTSIIFYLLVAKLYFSLIKMASLGLPYLKNMTEQPYALECVPCRISNKREKIRKDAPLLLFQLRHKF